MGLLALSLGIRSAEGAPSSKTTCIPAVPCTDPRGCPDLVVDPNYLLQSVALDVRDFAPDSCAVLEGEVGGSGTRRLLLFDSVTPNLGPGDLIIGDPADHPEWFDFDTCHGHPHFKEYADYRLWTPKGYADWVSLRAKYPDVCARDLLSKNQKLASQLISGNKRGFCVVDLLPSALPCNAPADPAKYFYCDTFTYHHKTYKANQGISVCWADAYGSYLDGQWIDITGLPPGDYVLEEEVNAEHFLQETNYSNDSVAITVTIP